AVAARYTQGPGMDEHLAQLREGATYYYEADGLGSITSLTDSGGAVVRTYVYNVFGWWASGSGTLLNPYHFTGRDSDTGWFTGFNYHRARYYDSQFGRFHSEDPISFDGGVNFYTYVENNPANFNDPYGLYKRLPGVPPVTNPEMVRFLQCMDKCTGREETVTATTNGLHLDPGHAAGTSVDISPTGTPSRRIFCCAGRCGAEYALDERKFKTKYSTGPHYHIQLVAPAEPKRNAIPPECRPCRPR
ncbi:MAG: RHS repeat-associated core domain-containing protein, partial [Candidatus Acidiferrales bacterium]